MNFLKFRAFKKFGFGMKKIGVIGLGYVGLPLCFAFSRYTNVIGFDIDANRVQSLSLDNESFENLTLTDDRSLLVDCNVFIVAVPTPVDVYKVPDLSAMEGACELLSEFLKPDDLVIFESTVYPGATRKVVSDILVVNTGLQIHSDAENISTGTFFLGYSPERINPGDTAHSLSNTSKVISGSSLVSVQLVRSIYENIVDADLVQASSIEVAEAAKVIENVQRDVNIALMNEFAVCFDALSLSGREIFKIAKTKWNFLNFEPGLVGGHCIGVDPYYFLHEIGRVGMESSIVRNARLVNESMVSFVVNKIMSCFRALSPNAVNIGVLGVTFKKNCDDVRNSKNLELCEALREEGFEVFWFDPLVSREFLIDNCTRVDSIDQMKGMDGVVYAVDHSNFNKSSIDLLKCKCFFDLQNAFAGKATWSL